MIDDTNKVEEATPAVEAQAEAAPSLTVQDLANLRNIIDVASRRGAFHANEFAVVGATYNKLDVFVKAAMPKKEEAEAETAEAKE